MVLVLWQDCQSHEGWNDLPKDDADVALPLIETVGWLIAESPTVVCVASSFDSSNESACMRMDIPRATIVQIQELDVLRNVRNAYKEQK
jgi:hypothetical protein